MKNYLDLRAIDTDLRLSIVTKTIGNPNYVIKVNNTVVENIIDYQLPLLEPIIIEVELYNKVYTLEYETAVIIERLSIDNIDLIPNYTHLADYINDHNNNNPTNYLGFNGKWTLTINRPFYHWLHQVQGQGWLLT